MTDGIRIVGASVSRQDRRILGPLDLDLSERRVAVLGRNGSGKSTLLRLVAGLVAPDAGTVTIGGIDVARDRRQALRRVGIIFQNPDHQIIFPTVIEEVAFGLGQLGASRSEARQQARQALARFGRADWADRSAATLSQGQRHLVCLISVLAMAPATILLDEPFSGLDLPTTRQLARMLDGLDQQIVHVTHDAQLIGHYDRALWIEGGLIVADGAPDEVLANYTRAMGQVDAFADL
jgi:biotin transport system ATP-binding protein